MVPARTLTAAHGGMLALCIALVAGCGGDEAADAARDQREAALATAFADEQAAWRSERREGLLKPDGWTSLVGLHWIEPGAHYVGSDADNGIRLAIGPAHLGLLRLENGIATFVPESGAAVTLDGAPLAAGATLRTDAAEEGPSVLAYDGGKGLATVIERGGRHALRVKHADAPTRVNFAGLEYWPGGRDWKVDAKFVPNPAGKTIPIVNIIGMTDEVPNPGAVEFRRDGRTFRLEALDEGDGQLFLIYADRTSGHGSYGAGRYLYADMPDAKGNVVLDFNRGYNPPCAFTAFATCPLPPPENRLDLAIAAGEKAYAKITH
jgi:uncharacterized protein (DUF1684 family)